MSGEPLAKKRKKKVDPCPNPLFVQWLTEWRDEAASQGKKTQYAFGKALLALKRYPMQLMSGKEAKILDHFGDKICNMLDHKLARYTAENEEPTPSVCHSALSSAMLPPQSSVRSDSLLHCPVAALNGPAERKRRPSNREPKEYVPVYRSGPYALILTLYKNHKSASGRDFMLKAELQREAQPLSEKHFTLPEPESRYTAWSSMSTLITKGFVSKEGSPARYSLTDSGCRLAVKLETVGAQFGQTACETSHPIGGHLREGAPAATTSQSRKRKGATRPGADTASSLAQAPAPVLATHGDPSPQRDKLQYWYIDDHGDQVISKDDAAVTIDDEISIGFLIKANGALLRKSGVRYKRDDTSPAEGDMVYVYLHNEDASDFCPIPVLTSHHTKSAAQSAGPSVLNGQPKLPSLPGSAAVFPPAPTLKRRHEEPTLANRPAGLGIGCGPVPSLTSASHHTTSLTSSRRPNLASDFLDAHGDRALQRGTESSAALSVAPGASSRVGSSVGTGSLDEESRGTTALKEPPVPMYVLRPGSFDIVLCVDSCETSGGVTKSRKQLLLPELQRNGVLLDVRRLQVGDFLWVARERRVPVPGMLQMPVARELALDQVVERKRMDDLCGSITDGRFKEQKFRLKQCGLRKPIYLIEEFGSIDHLSLPASTLKQAAVNTQVIDGFFVKHTRDSKESAAYLTLMTRYLQGHYSSKTLEAYRLEDLEKLPGSQKTSSRVQKLLTFAEVNQSSIKNKNTTVTETFAKQLLQFSGLTAEKALAITQRYRTPSDLLEAYKACAVEKDREKLLSSIKYGKLQRNVGPVLSRLLHLFYCTKGPLL